MKMKTLLRGMTADEREALALKLDTSVAHLYQISSGRRKAKPGTAQRWVALEPRLTLQDLRPDIWE